MAKTKPRTQMLLSALCAILISFLSRDVRATDWLQFGFDASHSGFNPEEGSIADHVESLQLLFQTPLPATPDGAPVFAKAIATAGGTRDMVFITTRGGHIVAIDAQSGEQIWMQQPATGPSTTTNSSPLIDPNRAYVYSYGLDGKVHKYTIADGVEVLVGGWPEVVTLKPDVEKASSALTFAKAADGNTYLYAATSNINDDLGDYQGHVTAINLATGAQANFNMLCSDAHAHFVETAGVDCSETQAGVWSRPGVVYDAALDRIFAATGNGPYSGDAGGFDWGESVVALTPSLLDANGKHLTMPIDSYTPPEYDALNQVDNDLGQTAPAIVTAPAGSKFAHLGVQIGKDGILRLLNLDDLSGAGGAGHTGGELQRISGLDFIPFFSAQPAVWVDPTSGTPWVFAVNNGVAYGFFLTADAQGNPGLVQAWSRTSYGGSTSVVADGLLFYAEQSLNLIAVDARTGVQRWSVPSGWAHWASPIVVDGKVFFADNFNTLRAYAEPPASMEAIEQPHSSRIITLPPPLLALPAHP